MKTGASKPEWNEIQFLSWNEFRQMAPTILQLEVSRIGRLLETPGVEEDFRNGLVRARFALREFIACVQRSDRAGVEASCAKHLQAAIMGFPPPPPKANADTVETCRYIVERLEYVNNRIPLIY